MRSAGGLRGGQALKGVEVLSRTASDAHPQSRHVVLTNRLRHHYVDTGGEGPTVVFLHGYTDSWRSFELLFPTLAQRFRLLLLDQRGHGYSERGHRYAIRDFAQDAIEFIDTVAKGPVHLVGHSLGSIVAQRVAAARPDIVRSLVLIGAARSAADHPGLLELKAELAALGSQIPRDFVSAFQKSTTYREIEPVYLDTFVQESLRLHPETWHGALDGLLTDWELTPSPKPHSSLAHPPSLSLWGARDTVFDKGAQVELARHLRHLTAIHYPDAGHAPHWEIPDRVARDIADFLVALDEQPPVRKKELHHASG
jgi:non-heme chloroperoxidase